MPWRPVDNSMGTSGLIKQRLLTSVIDLVAGEGCQAVAVERIALAAGTTLEGFERHFDNEEDCLRAAFEEVCERFDCYLMPLYLVDEPWRERIRTVAYAAAEYCGGHENEIRFILATRDRFGGLERVERSLQFHLGQIDPLRRDWGEESDSPSLAAEVSLGSFLETVGRLSVEQRLRDLPGLVPDLLYSLFRAFLGADAAAKELGLAWNSRFDVRSWPVGI